jgi:hypothetical protein
LVSKGALALSYGAGEVLDIFLMPSFVAIFEWVLEIIS